MGPPGHPPWDRLASFRRLPSVRLFSGALIPEAFTPDESRVITVFEDGSARVWDQSKAPAGNVLEGHTGLIYAVAISPDCAQAITCSVDKSLRIWDLTRGSQTRAIENLPAGVWSVSYSRDGKQIAIGLHDNRVEE